MYFCKRLILKTARSNELNMKTKEEIKKIETVVLYILREFREGVDYIKLFKIMYFAQKDYLLS